VIIIVVLVVIRVVHWGAGIVLLRVLGPPADPT
jgi:hypothetical protein